MLIAICPGTSFRPEVLSAFLVIDATLEISVCDHTPAEDAARAWAGEHDVNVLELTPDQPDPPKHVIPDILLVFVHGSDRATYRRAIKNDILVWRVWPGDVSEGLSPKKNMSGLRRECSSCRKTKEFLHDVARPLIRDAFGLSTDEDTEDQLQDVIHELPKAVR